MENWWRCCFISLIITTSYGGSKIMRVHHLPLLISRTCTILDETNLKKQEILELVIIRNEILEVPNLKLVFLTFERSEIWQKLKNKKKRLSFQLYRDSNSDCQIHRQLSLPLYQNHLINNCNREIRQDCNFCQISLLSKVRKTSLRLGTFKISFLIVTNSSHSRTKEPP